MEWSKNKMTYRYKNYVHFNLIELDKSEDCRFLIAYNLDDGRKDKKALVVMKNPSKADRDVSDQTINNVLEYMHEFRYAQVYIMNLIPKYGTDSGSMKDDLSKRKDLLKKNDDLICEISREVSKVFVAWGGKSGFDKKYYSERINSVKNCLKDKTMYCYARNKTDQQPVHPSRNQWKRGKPECDFEIYE